MVGLFLFLALVGLCFGWWFMILSERYVKEYRRRQYQFYAVGCWFLGLILALIAAIYFMVNGLF